VGDSSPRVRLLIWIYPDDEVKHEISAASNNRLFAPVGALDLRPYILRLTGEATGSDRCRRSICDSIRLYNDAVKTARCYSARAAKGKRNPFVTNLVVGKLDK